MSTKVKTILIVVVLLVGIAGFNYFIKMDPTQLAARGVGKDPHAHDHAHDEEGDHETPEITVEDLTMPIGPEDAPVKIEVLWQNRGELEQALRPMLSSIASAYGGHVRVEFIDPASEEYKRLVEEVSEGMPSGLLINGEMIKDIPEADLGFVAFSGSPSFQEWTAHDLQLAIEHELEKNGIEFEPQVEHDHSGQAGHGHGSHAGHGH
jgi:hypothetical protein